MYKPFPFFTFSFLFFALFSFVPVFGDETNFSFEIGKDRTVVLREGDRPLWQYNADLVLHENVPEKDARRIAGSYMHPLYGVDGETLTDDAPKDHYHHHGIFWTWPHITLHRPDGKTEKYDTWLSDTRMKQLFVRFLDFKVEKGKAVFRVENGWFIGPETNRFVWDEQGNPVSEKVVSEFVTVTTHPIVEENDLRSRAVDFDFEWVLGAFPISLRGAGGKSYGGLTVRFRPSQGKPGGESTITVPDGVAADDLPEAPLPWADYTSKFHRDAEDNPTGERSGAAVFVPTNHPDYPPTWLTRYYGPLCVGWPGVEERKFEAGQKIRLSYRIWIHDRPVDAETLKKAYERYTE